jgi:hypothetical protein
MSIFVVLTAYYKHGEADTKIFMNRVSLENYLIEQIKKYNSGWTLEEDSLLDPSVDGRFYALIRIAVHIGKTYVSDQNGWGVIKITEICETDGAYEIITY